MTALLVLLVVSSLAMAKDYKYVTQTELEASVGVQLVDEVAPPEGVLLEWEASLGGLKVTVQNGGESVLQVSWDDSAFVDGSGVAHGIVPGTTLRGDYKAVTPPSTIPPGAKLMEMIVRESAVDLTAGAAADEPLFLASDYDKEVAVTLALTIAGEQVFHTQQFSVGPDHDALAAIESRRRAEVLYQKKWDKYTGYRKKAIIFGSALGGGGAVMSLAGASAVAEEPTPEGWATLTVAGVVPMAVGTALAVHFSKKAKAEKAKLPRKPAGYQPE